eukprot:CAMPEP_0197189388 /NCGR_PEP_ID=MMETSP1423-20130617/19676_1 /TAXON_ID=476441 /ORGANISM="Pseudo-nitzschia heimii, Strain UNC1101" /LENGTH=852 /DNA_ID=CAMNT_0042641489 /DNA_START=112 /DNA_END=2670 /DNA_ORIENTATION=+
MITLESPSSLPREYTQDFDRRTTTTSSSKGSRMKAKRSTPKWGRQGRIEAHQGVLSELGCQHVSRSPKAKHGPGTNNVAALFLVGRRFRYVTRKGERKNYEIQSYLPWNGTYRVRRTTDRFGEDDENHAPRNYKTKLIDLNILPNIHWLDDDQLICMETEESRPASPLPEKLPERPEALEEERSSLPSSPSTRTESFQDIDMEDSAQEVLAIPHPSPDPTPRRKERRCDSLHRRRKPQVWCPEKLLSARIEKGVSNRIDECETLSSKSETPDAGTNDPQKPSSRSSRYNGVFTNVRSYQDWNSKMPANPWRSQCHRVTIREKLGKTHIGVFKTEIEAARAYDDVLRKYGSDILHLLNFPTASERLQLEGLRGASGTTNRTSSPSTTTATTEATTETTDIKTCDSQPLETNQSSSSSLSTNHHPPATGDRIACSNADDDSSLHFGTLMDREESKMWTVSFDTGETRQMNEVEVTGVLEQYETLLRKEACYPIPAEGSPNVGDRIACDFGSSGIQIGFIDRCADHLDGNDQEAAWRVTFDDGDDLELESAEIRESLELYRRIRQKKSLLESQDDSEDSCDEMGDEMDVSESAASISTQRLRDVALGDRIAYDFGAAGVYFGSVEESHGCDSKSREDWSWDIEFDDGECYNFDASEMAESIALYDTIREREREDPSTKEKIREWREEHLAEKRRVMTRIPQRAKDRFLEVGFAQWNRTYLPVLFLGPYDVSAGPIREQWLEAFSRASKRKVPQIVYWFGSEPGKGFSILEESDCLSLRCARGRNLLDPKISRSKAAFEHNRALGLLRQAEARPKNRSRLGLDVREIHERLSGPGADRLLAEFEAADGSPGNLACM